MPRGPVHSIAPLCRARFCDGEDKLLPVALSTGVRENEEV